MKGEAADDCVPQWRNSSASGAWDGTLAHLTKSSWATKTRCSNTVRNACWKLHVRPPRDNFMNLHKPGERWTDAPAPDGVTILAPYKQYQPSDHPGLRTGDASQPMQLFDLQTDPREHKDRAAQPPEIVARLKKLYDETNQLVPAPAQPVAKPKSAK